MKYRVLACMGAWLIVLAAGPAVAAQADASASSGHSQTAQQPAASPAPAQGPQAAPATVAAPSAQPTAPQQKEKPKVKAGSKDDVEAVGKREMGGKGLGNWYSIEREVSMGKQYAAMIESSVRMVSDPVVSEYVNRVGQNLVRNSDSKVPFTIKVIDSDEVNAFALPGGFFYVNSGLVLAADEEAELAGVMSHEIAHVAARHATRQMTRGNLANLASIPLIFVGGGIGYAVRSAAGLGLPLTFLRFSRGFEEEADFLGLQYMYKAGYDPQAYITFFEKIQAREKRKPGTLAKAFSTHPQTPDRISKTQREIARILPAREQYVISTSEFDNVKIRLAAIENRRKTVGPARDDQPSLRRTKTKDKKGKTTEDDRPTLQRRDDREKQ